MNNTKTVSDSLATQPAGHMEAGLSASTVITRRAEHGFNEVLQAKPHPVRKFPEKFWGLSAWMLELIVVLSAVLGKYANSWS